VGGVYIYIYTTGSVQWGVYIYLHHRLSGGVYIFTAASINVVGYLLYGFFNVAFLVAL
jgi:hypothetical protein